MTSQAQVPDELWVEVFKYLPKTSLRDVSSTHRTFSRISRPLVFSDFDFHPFAGGAGGTVHPSAAEVKRSFERLNFWCSPEIAPLVRSCKITPWPRYPRNFSDTETPYILPAAFFDRLSCFTRLQTLYAMHVEFTQIGVVGLCRLPVLKRLHIGDCIVAAREHADTTALSLKVSSFILERGLEGVDRWIALLDPDLLREMDVALSSHIFARTMANTSSFPHVHKLSAIMDNSTVFDLLSKFPAVQTLTMDWGGADPTVHISGLLPALTEYTGPCSTLRLFLPRGTLTHLATTRCLPADFLTQLEGIGLPHNIPSLDLNFADFDRAALDKLCRFFPRLTDLQITIFFGGEDGAFSDDANPEPTTFCHALATSPALPPTLKNIAISWYYEGEDYYENVPPVDESDFARLRDALVARCPTLTSLWFDGHEFLFRWRKGLDGTVNEATAANFENLRLAITTRPRHPHPGLDRIASGIVVIPSFTRRRDEINGHHMHISALSPLGLPHSHCGNTPHTRVVRDPPALSHTPRELAGAGGGHKQSPASVAVLLCGWRIRARIVATPLHEMGTPPNENENNAGHEAADYRAERPRRTQSRAQAHARSHPATHHPLRRRRTQILRRALSWKWKIESPGAVSPPSLGAASIDVDAVPYTQSIDAAQHDLHATHP
ncbi:hypothetical protein DFH09DRAFT_1506489 [Mycena vulgaris]|nr:hypothetical protein DFH09DRAFT_1506489 [Mycena vulgaris]